MAQKNDERKTTVWERRMENVRKRKERELNASVWPNDKLRVIPTHYQTVQSGAQVLQFRPTEVIDDPYRIKLMDELDIEYRIVSRPPRKPFPVPIRSGDKPPENPDPNAQPSVQQQNADPVDPDAGLGAEHAGEGAVKLDPVSGNVEDTGVTELDAQTVETPEGAAAVKPDDPLAQEAGKDWKPSETED